MNYKFLSRASLVLPVVVLLLTSCGSKKAFLESVTPQEQALTLTKLTDEAMGSVVGNKENVFTSNWMGSGYARGAKGFSWNTGNRLSVSPDGENLAYISIVDNASNVMVRKTTPGSPSTQRTFRRAQNVFWGNDNRLYFNDNTANSSTIGSIDSKKGSLVRQLTSNNNDWNPSMTKDCSKLYFTRYDNSGPSIWCLETSTGELSNCTRGYSAMPIGDSNTKIICTRNSTKGNSEIWMIDIENGDETLILSDVEKGFSDPQVSPDGQWIVVVANSLSTISKKQNTDIYAVKTDGTMLTQITNHPEIDCSPVFSPDGKYIYFISSRANKDRKFNIWRISNPLIK